MTAATRARPRRWSRVSAWALWALVMLGIPVAVWLNHLLRQAGRSDQAAACTLTAVFTPTVDGQRVDGVDVGITLTVGVAAVVDALAACRCRILHPRSSEAW